MELKEIASLSGKSGLFKVLKPTRTGVILESIDETKSKLVANANNRLSLLNEISVYTTGKESSVPLEDVLKSIHKKHGTKLSVSSKSEPQELASFMSEVLPEYDRERVYLSDIKKLVSWYSILADNYPEVLQGGKAEAKEAKAEKTEKEPKKEKESAEASEEKKAPKKPAAKKSSK